MDGWRIGRDSTRWYLDLYGEPNAAGWRRTQEMMRDMDQRLRARGGRLVVAASPLLVDFDRYPFETADAEDRPLLRRERAPTIGTCARRWR